MSSKPKICVVIGTRPEAIKLAPVVLALQNSNDFDCWVCATAQHRTMLDQVLEVFQIVPDADLHLMRPGQTLADLTSRAIQAMNEYLQEEKPDLVVVQGDTTTVFAASLASFYCGIPVAHVEAGLRTGNMLSPWPEEANRVLTSDLATLHFAPTATSKNNLLAEGIPAKRIFVTGNTVIDALFLAVEKVRSKPQEVPGLPSSVLCSGSGKRLVLITGHRRESFGEKLESICLAIRDLALFFPNVEFVYPVHLNPNVQNTVTNILGNGSTLPNIHLIEPLAYLPFITLMERSALILTDSGGIQEEGPSLGKPVLVTRDTTERPEAVTAGTVRIVGADRQKIFDEVNNLLTDTNHYELMSRAHNPYGDGKATGRIIHAIRNYFKK